MDEKRQYTRLPFATEGEFDIEGKTWKVEVIDLSIQGALIRMPADWPRSDDPEWITQQSKELDFRLLLSDDVTIAMQCTVAHQEACQLGLACCHIDDQSISHLRRLMVLNLGDASLLDRELEKLWSEMLSASNNFMD